MKILTKNYILKEMTSSMVTKNYFNWFNDSEVEKYIDYKPKNISELKNQVKVANNNNTVLFWGIFSKKKHIGNLKIFEIDHKRNIARLGILIGYKEFRNKGVGSEVIEAVKNHLIQKITVMNTLSLMQMANNDLIWYMGYLRCFFEEIIRI